MYAMTPWSGHYTVNQAIWTSAHYTQFFNIMDEYVDGATQYLNRGGSYSAVVDPNKKENWSIVVEKLHGDCLRCEGPKNGTADETVSFFLDGFVIPTDRKLHVFKTSETDSFQQLDDLSVDENNVVTIEMERDTIVTLTTTTGQQKGSFDIPIPPDTDFGLPYDEDFESYDVSTFPKYFSDNGGSWEIAEEGVFMQKVDDPPINNAWTLDYEPITVIGSNNSWSENIVVSVDAGWDTTQYSSDENYVGVCVHVVFVSEEKQERGHCLELFGAATGGQKWRITEWNETLAIGELKTQQPQPQPQPQSQPIIMRKLTLAYNNDNTLTAEVDGVVVTYDPIYTKGGTRIGRAALVSGWNEAYFDNFRARKGNEDYFS